MITGWLCPKCGWCWGPMVTGCANCNKVTVPAVSTAVYSTGSTYPAHSEMTPKPTVPKTQSERSASVQFAKCDGCRYWRDCQWFDVPGKLFDTSWLCSLCAPDESGTAADVSAIQADSSFVCTDTWQKLCRVCDSPASTLAGNRSRGIPDRWLCAQCAIDQDDAD